MNQSTDLQAASSPEAVPSMLRRAADLFNESAVELPAQWGDPRAGQVWADFARILQRAANSCDMARVRRGV